MDIEKEEAGKREEEARREAEEQKRAEERGRREEEEKLGGEGAKAAVVGSGRGRGRGRGAGRGYVGMTGQSSARGGTRGRDDRVTRRKWNRKRRRTRQG